jgi:aspartyl protease family protein
MSRESGPVIYKTVLPAMALFGAAALGLLALGHQLVGQTSANAVVTAPASEANGSNYVSASQLRTASLRKEGDGHYWASARVNGVPVKFLVDTGATRVAFTRRDALRIGLNLDDPNEILDVRTAAGRMKATGAMIRTLQIDGVEVKNVSAVVIEEGLEYSLLGMSFLNRLNSWVVTPNAIIIHE